jgi:CHAT domain-containing protein/tetratricopeptide (TPR) repeat protein
LIVGGYLAVGDCYRGKADFKNAMLYYRKALVMGRAVFDDNHVYVASAHYGMGRTLEERRGLKEALNYYQRSLKSISGKSVTPHSDLDNVIGKPLFFEVLARKGTLLKKLYAEHSRTTDYLKRSLSAFQQAIRVVDKTRMSFKNDGSKLFLGERSAGIYEDAIRTALQLFDVTKNKIYRDLSFSFAQKSKANLLREKLHESEAKQFSGIPDSLLAKEDSLRAGLTYYDTIIKNARSGARHRDKASLQKMKERYFSLNREFDALREQFERDYPKYYQLKYKTQAVSVERVQDALDTDSVLLEYVVTDSDLFIFAISKDEFHVKNVAIDSSFGIHIEGMLSGIRHHNYAEYVENAHPAYVTLVHPLMSWLANKNRLIIVPDGLISSVPFEALLTHEASQNGGRQDYRTLPYLNKKFTVSYGYSTGLLFETVSNHVAQEPTLDYLAFAPAFSKGLNGASVATLSFGNGAKSSVAGAGDISLPGARSEVFAIKNMFDKSYRGVQWFKNKLSGQLTRVYVGDAATEDKLKSSKLAHSRYVHFATHGVVNKELPSLSGLAFGQETNDEDGVLYLGEIYNLKLNADLVVLSACETANGKWVEGEGLISFARGFLYAGARSLLVSLWKVSDVSTSNVMQEFYQGLLNGNSMANALKEAKDKMIASEYDFAMPYYWASFVAVGK